MKNKKNLMVILIFAVFSIILSVIALNNKNINIIILYLIFNLLIIIALLKVRNKNQLKMYKKDTVIINPENLRKDSIFGKVIQYGNTNKEIKGVEDKVNLIRMTIEDYHNDLEQLKLSKFSLLENEFDKWKIHYRWREVFTWISIGSTLVFFIMVIGQGFIASVYLLVLIIFSINIFSVTLRSILGALEIVKVKKYRMGYADYMNSVFSINDKYEKIANQIYNEIDICYLDSLEPAHREIVLMRRDQERQHQEQMRLQHEHHMRMEAEQREHQWKLENEQRRRAEEQKLHEKKIVDEQRRARKAQEELLYIEKERERDRLKYR